MIILPRHFVRFIDGRAGERVIIAFLPGHLGAHIGTLETNVALRRDYALKLLRHRIKYDEFEEIQSSIERGDCLKSAPNQLSFLYFKKKSPPEIYFLLLKTNSRKDEVWLVTFYRITKKQYSKRIVKGEILQYHQEVDFMG